MPMVISLLWKFIGRSRTCTGKLRKQKHTFLFQRSILFTITENWLSKRTAILNCISNSVRLWCSSFYVNVLREDSGSIWVNQAEFLEELTIFKASSQTPWNLRLTMRLATPSHRLDEHLLFDVVEQNYLDANSRFRTNQSGINTKYMSTIYYWCHFSII